MANLSKSMAMIKRSNRAQRQPHHFKVTLLEVSSPRESSRGDITVYPAAHDCQHLARKEKVLTRKEESCVFVKGNIPSSHKISGIEALAQAQPIIRMIIIT